MAGHTPGPWSVVIDDSGDRPVSVPSIQAAEEYDCAIVHWDGFWQEHWQSARGNREMRANARLIAAAPDLLEALQAILADCGEAMLDGYVENSLHSDEVNAARAAIAKASGK
jgi:hypothetical protein